MRFERITDASHAMYSEAMTLYCESFPVHELRESASQERILHDMAYHFNLAYDGFAGYLEEHIMKDVY